MKKKNTNKNSNLNNIAEKLDVIIANQNDLRDFLQVILSAINDVDYCPSIDVDTNNKDVEKGFLAVCGLLNDIRHGLTIKPSKVKKKKANGKKLK